MKVAQHIWRCVLKPATGPSPTTHTEAARDFARIWDETSNQPTLPRGHSRGSKQRPIFELLAWLEGIDRLLASRRDRDPAFSAEQHKEILGTREMLAKLVRAGLCPAMLDLFNRSDIDEHQHMLALRCMGILRAAILVVPSGGVPTWFLDEAAARPSHTSGQRRLVTSIAQAGNEVDLLDRAALQDEGDDWLSLHEATARLQLMAATPAPEVSALNQKPATQHRDPLAPLSERLQPVQKFRERANSDTFFYQALGFLLPGFEGFKPAKTQNGERAARAVARMLSAIAPQHLHQLFQNRPVLTDAVLNGGAPQWRGEAIATPPGVGVPGLVGVESGPSLGEQRVVRVNFKDGQKVSFCPPDLPWVQGEPLANDALRSYSAPLGQHHHPRPRREGDQLPPTALPWLADAFTSLAGSQGREDKEICPATALNIVGREITEPGRRKRMARPGVRGGRIAIVRSGLHTARSWARAGAYPREGPSPLADRHGSRRLSRPAGCEPVNAQPAPFCQSEHRG